MKIVYIYKIFIFFTLKYLYYCSVNTYLHISKVTASQFKMGIKRTLFELIIDEKSSKLISNQPECTVLVTLMCTHIIFIILK